MNSTIKETPKFGPTNVPSLGPERPVAWPKRTTRTLANGMQIVLVETHRLPKITAELFFRSGNAVVAARAPGLAEITASVVRTGTANRDSQTIEEHLRRMGADLGRSAGADTSAISISGLAEFADGLLAMIADLARNAAFPANEFERVRRQKLEDVRIERTTPAFIASREIASRPFRRASIRHRRAQRSASGILSPRATSGILRRPLRPVGRVARNRRRFQYARDARLDRKNLWRMERADLRRNLRIQRRPLFTAGEYISCIFPGGCRPTCSSAIALSRASILIGIASASQIRFTAARSIRGW